MVQGPVQLPVPAPVEAAVPPLAWVGAVVAGQGLAAGPDRVQHVALGPVAAPGPRGPVDLDTHSPWSTRNRVSPAPSQPVPSSAQTRRPGHGPGPAGAAGHGRPGRLAPPGWPAPAVGVQHGRGVAIAVGVDPDDGVNLALEHRHRGCSFQDGDRCWHRPGWQSPRGGRTVTGHAPRRTGFSIRPATMVGQADAGSSRTDQPQGTPPGGQRGLGSRSLPAPACQHPDWAPKAASQRGLLRARARRARAPGRPGLPPPGRPPTNHR